MCSLVLFPLPTSSFHWSRRNQRPDKLFASSRSKVMYLRINPAKRWPDSAIRKAISSIPPNIRRLTKRNCSTHRIRYELITCLTKIKPKFKQINFQGSWMMADDPKDPCQNKRDPRQRTKLWSQHQEAKSAGK